MENKEAPTEKQINAQYSRKFAGFKRSLKSKIEKLGLHAFELQYKMLKENPKLGVLNPYFSHGDHLIAFEEAINEYKESLKLNQ